MLLFLVYIVCYSGEQKLANYGGLPMYTIREAFFQPPPPPQLKFYGLNWDFYSSFLFLLKCLEKKRAIVYKLFKSLDIKLNLPRMVHCRG